MFVKEFECLPSVVYGFFVGNRTLRPRDSEGGTWIFCVYVEVKLLEGVRVVVDADEGNWVVVGCVVCVPG